MSVINLTLPENQLEEMRLQYYRDMLAQAVTDADIHKWRDREKILWELRARAKEGLRSRRQSISVSPGDLLTLCEMIDRMGDEISSLVQDKINGSL